MASTPPVGATPVTGAIRKASQATGAGFDYLLATAKVESDLDPNLTMGSSSATGLFQFIDQTWLGTLKQAGPAFGYGNYADAITLTSSGRYLVEDPALRNEIMQLRKDPAANAMMGGAFTQQNAAVMASRLGRMPTEGELYIGHFFGPYAGAKAIALAQSYPNANAAEIFPAAAQANRSIFYDSRGYARSVASVCAELTRRYQAARSDTSALAATVPPVPPAPIPVRRLDRLAAVARAAGAGARASRYRLDQARGVPCADAGRDGLCDGHLYAGDRSRHEGCLDPTCRCRRHVSFAVPDGRAARGGLARDP